MAMLDSKLLRYFFTAGMAAVVDIGGFALLRKASVPIGVAAIASFCVATVVNYLLSSRYAFNQRPTFKGYRLFFVAALGGLATNVLVTLIGSRYAGIDPVLAKVVGVGTAFLLNFWLNARLVFRAKSVSNGP